MVFLKEGKTNWKYILIVAILAILVGIGVLWWINQQDFSIEFPEIKRPEKVVEEETADRKTYRNEKYGFEFKYPPIPPGCENCKIEGGSEGFGVNTTILTIVDYLGENFSEFIDSITEKFNVETKKEMLIDGREAIRVEYRFDGTDKYGSSTFIKKAYKIIIIDFRSGSLCCDPKMGRVYELEVYESILSTFRFIESLPVEIRSDESFINWITKWRVVKPTYTIEKFTKIDEERNYNFDQNWKDMMFREIRVGEEIINIDRSILDMKAEKHGRYSPNKTKFIRIGGYPDPFEIDQDVTLFNLSTKEYQHLKTCGTACWFEKVFWIDDSHFIVIRMGEYHYLGQEEEKYYGPYFDYIHSIFFYDLEENVVSEYRSSEIISWEEKQEFRK